VHPPSGQPAVDADDLLERCAFPDFGQPVSLGVSGGPDSLALLVLAVRAGLGCVAIHVDHGLRSGSAADADLVRDVARRYGARFEARRVVVAAGPDLEARARWARYRALPPGVCTGHTMDDQAETVLLAVLRGAGLDGLAGMRPTDDPSRPHRPLVQLRRWETQALCAAEGLTPLADPSNADPRFRRNRVRGQVLPLLAEVAERDLVPVLARQADLLAADGALLEAWAVAIDPTDARALQLAPLPLARRAVRRWLRGPDGCADGEGHPPSAAEVARVLAVAKGEVRACEVSGGRRVERHGGRLTLVAR
jgi:tRNA(Ile)-lysidine synthase